LNTTTSPADGQEPLLERRHRRPVDELVDQDVIADQQVLLHRAGGDLERLHHPGAGEGLEHDGDEQGLQVLPEQRFFRRHTGGG
jgi:hypothetical protein